jgi:hypothetical protein
MFRVLAFLLTLFLTISLPQSGKAQTVSTSKFYLGGQVMTGDARGIINVYLIWVGQWNKLNPVALKIIPYEVENLGGTQYWDILGTYLQSNGQAASSQLALRQTIEVDDSGAIQTSFTNAQVQQLIAQSITSKKLPLDLDGIYVVATAANITVQNPSGVTLCNVPSGEFSFHNSFVDESSQLKYAVITDDSQNPCSVTMGRADANLSQFKNQGIQTVSAEFMAGNLAHELAETITDIGGSAGRAYYTPSSSESIAGTGEIADMCDVDQEHIRQPLTLGRQSFIVPELPSNVNEKPSACGLAPSCTSGYAWDGRACAPIVNGQCGVEQWQCTGGTTADSHNNGSASAWTCQGSNGGSNSGWCHACDPGYAWSGSACAPIVNGRCGAEQWQCTAGTTADRHNDGSASAWTCQGRNGGSNSGWCSACDPGYAWNGSACAPAVNGQCGAEQWLCAAGATADRHNDGSVSVWTCQGSNGGSNSDWCRTCDLGYVWNGSSCALIVNGKCGAEQWQCAAGTATDGRNDGSMSTWTCQGSNGRSNSDSCRACDLRHVWNGSNCVSTVR